MQTDTPDTTNPSAPATAATQPEPTAYDKLLRVAASVERAKFALGLKGFFDPAQTQLGGLIDEVLQDVPYVDHSQPIWWRESDEATLERAAQAGYTALTTAQGAEPTPWETLPETNKAGHRAAAKAILAIRK